MIENVSFDSPADLDNTEIEYELTHESDETENGVVRVDEIVSSTESDACNSQAIAHQNVVMIIYPSFIIHILILPHQNETKESNVVCSRVYGSVNINGLLIV